MTGPQMCIELRKHWPLGTVNVHDVVHRRNGEYFVRTMHPILYARTTEQTKDIAKAALDIALTNVSNDRGYGTGLLMRMETTYPQYCNIDGVMKTVIHHKVKDFG